MARRPGRVLTFKKSYREQRNDVARWLNFYRKEGAAEIPMIEKKTRAAPRKLEAPVIDAISDLLAVHPRVAWAIRLNSGMAWNESGAPVSFFRVLKPRAKELKLSDFIGALIDGRPFAFEAKAPGFKGPRNEREFAQGNFLNLIKNIGGIAAFVTSADEVNALL